MKTLTTCLLMFFLSLSGIVCNAPAYNTWHATKTYTPPAKVKYNGGVWECRRTTQGDVPGVLKPDSSSPWNLLSGYNWTHAYDLPNEYYYW